MGEIRTFTPRPDAPAAHPLTVDEQWALLAAALRAAEASIGEVLALIEAGAPVPDRFAALVRLDGQIVTAGTLALALHGAETAAPAARGG